MSLMTLEGEERTTDVPSSEGSQSDVIVLDTELGLPAQPGLDKISSLACNSTQSLISLSSSTLDESDTCTDMNGDKTWDDADDDITSDSDDECFIIKPHLDREQNEKAKDKVKGSCSENVIIEDVKTNFQNVSRENAASEIKPDARCTETTAMELRRSSRCLNKLKFLSEKSYRNGGSRSQVLRSNSLSKMSQEPPKKKMKVSSEYPVNYQHMVNTRSVTRRLGSEGCVFQPPTPEDALEWKRWPEDGMNCRPTWPDAEYEMSKLPQPPASELQASVHHSLHAVLAYAAQVTRNVSEKSKRSQLKMLSSCINMETKRSNLQLLETATGLHHKICCDKQETCSSNKQMNIENANNDTTVTRKRKHSEETVCDNCVSDTASAVQDTHLNFTAQQLKRIHLDDINAFSTDAIMNDNVTSCNKNILQEFPASDIFSEATTCSQCTSKSVVLKGDILDSVNNLENVSNLTTFFKANRNVGSDKIFHKGESISTFPRDAETDKLAILHALKVGLSSKLGNSSVRNVKSDSSLRKNDVGIFSAELKQLDNEKLMNPLDSVSSFRSVTKQEYVTKNQTVVVESTEMVSNPPDGTELGQTHRYSSNINDTENVCTATSTNNYDTDDSDEAMKDDWPESLMALMRNTGILYCALCSVPQEALAQYIDSLSTESAIEWLQEMD